MKNQPTKSKPGALLRIVKATFTSGLLPALVLLFSIQSSNAGSATWNLNPTNGDWFTASNWTPATVPNGPNDTATFGVSNITYVSTGYTATVEVNEIVFDPGASAYTITAEYFYPGLTISGVGITNNSRATQTFATGSDGFGFITFTTSATAGRLTAFTFPGGGCGPGGHGSRPTILTAGPEPSYGGTFTGTSSAGSAIVTNFGAQCAESYGASTSFRDSSTAADGTFINWGDYAGANSGGSTQFYDTSTAGNSTLIAYAGWYGGGWIWFDDDSTGGTARVEVFENGSLFLSFHNAPGVTVGSIEGTGNVYTGANNLTVGSNNLSMTFSGLIQDIGAGGSFTKIGTGTLTLTNGGNAYTGGTTIEGGKLVVNNMSGSGTSSGAVQVHAGTLGGRGTIAGAVTFGTGSGPGAVLAPGESTYKAGTLTIQSTLTFNSDATYKCELKTKRGIADKVVANGVTISGAVFSFVACGTSALPPGTILTVIDNSAATPIAGTFSNLADGSTFTAGSNTFQASYEGGDGNDLTLTVQ